MGDGLERMLTRWVAAGVLDEASAVRIRAFETERRATEGSQSERRVQKDAVYTWPMRLAIGFGALLLSAGVLLFVSSHWDALSPAQRFALVLTMVASFHLAGAGTIGRYPALAEGLHAIGTVSLGAGIFLAGQIFNMAERWPAGVLLWAAGAWLAWWLLRHQAQLFLVALLTPAWFVSEWLLVLQRAGRLAIDSEPVLPAALVLIALSYFTAFTRPREAAARPSAVGHAPRRAFTVLVMLGGVALVPALLFLAIATSSPVRTPPVSGLLLAIAWIMAAGVPLGLSVIWRGTAAWMNAAATAWVLLLLWMSAWREPLLLHGWWALGGLGLVTWGVRESRVERIDLGAAVFAVTVVFFYFSSVMDKLGRSASLVGVGLLFLAGGWALEHTRRRLVRTARETPR